MLASMSLLKQRLKLQAGIIKKGLLPSIVFSNALIDEHARVGAMSEARKVFDLMPDRNIFTWNAIIHGYARNHDLARARGMFDCALEKDAVTYNSMISGYTRHGMVGEAIHVFRLMRKDGVSADDFTHTSMLNLAADVSGVVCGIQIHGDMVKSGNGSASFSVSALIDMYSKGGRLSDAVLVFNEVKEYDDTVCRNAVLAACCREGNLKLGFDLFWCEPQSNDAVSWNTMISGCADNGDWGMALKLFVLMGENGIGRTEHSFSCGLRACTSSKSLDRGKEIHAYAIRNQLLSNPYISSGLVGLYSKCEKLDYAKRVHRENRRENVFSTASLIMGLVDEGNMVDARRLFDESNERNAVIWTNLFSGYVRFHQCEELFDLFTEYMRNEMVPCDVLILINVVSACSLQSDLDHGKQTHAYVLRNGIEMEEKLESAMVDMYAKCGKLQYSEEIFRQANVKDSVLYNAMMFGFAHHGRAKETLELLDEMLHEGFKPDEVTFIALLSACRHAGLVELGERYFTSMVKDYGVLPSIDHYSCMVDLYGRANHLDKALNLIRKMPWEADGVIWGSFLHACRVNGNMEMTKLSEEKLLHIEANNGARYVQLANAYAAEGEWIELGRIRRQMRLHGAKRSAGCSWIHIGNKINVFTSGFTRHLEGDAIFEMLAKINGEILLLTKASREMRKDDIFSSKNLLFTCIGEGCRPSICQTADISKM